MNFLINPYISIGNINFGMTKKDIHSILGSPTESFKRNEYSINEIDNYTELGAFISYDKNNNFEAIEFYSPKYPPIFMDIDLYNIEYYSLKEEIELIDSDIEEDSSGFTSYKIGIGVYCPKKDNESKGSVESLIVFKKGYYD